MFTNQSPRAIGVTDPTTSHELREFWSPQINLRPCGSTPTGLLHLGPCPKPRYTWSASRVSENSHESHQVPSPDKYGYPLSMALSHAYGKADPPKTGGLCWFRKGLNAYKFRRTKTSSIGIPKRMSKVCHRHRSLYLAEKTSVKLEISYQTKGAAKHEVLSAVADLKVARLSPIFSHHFAGSKFPGERAAEASQEPMLGSKLGGELRSKIVTRLI